MRNLQRRKFCLVCSPFGSRNTLSSADLLGIPRHCRCGENDPSRFYGQKSVCIRCHNNYTMHRGADVKAKARQELGGKCCVCGYEKFQVSLDIHHKDPESKDPNFRTMRSWSWERVQREIKGCVLLCKNCHAALHCGLIGL
jgi:hypothetical protein